MITRITRHRPPKTPPTIAPTLTGRDCEVLLPLVNVGVDKVVLVDSGIELKVLLRRLCNVIIAGKMRIIRLFSWERKRLAFDYFERLHNQTEEVSSNWKLC